MANNRGYIIRIEPPDGEPEFIKERARRALGEFVKALARRQARIDFEEEQQAVRQARQNETRMKGHHADKNDDHPAN